MLVSYNYYNKDQTLTTNREWYIYISTLKSTLQHKVLTGSDFLSSDSLSP